MTRKRGTVADQVKEMQERYFYLRSAMSSVLSVLEMPDADPARIVAAVAKSVRDALDYTKDEGEA